MNLSDKKIDLDFHCWYKEEDVKQFIKELKEEFCNCKSFKKHGCKCNFCDEIDALAGEASV